MSMEDYNRAHHSGQHEYRACVARGQSPYLAVLDDILVNTSIATTERLGLVNIPMNSIAGTKTSGRHTAFAPNFMPLLPMDTEFASKWSNLCDAHLREGIRVPIKAYEFMNRFYIEEGNKRVSVLKYFDAVSIPGTVTRLIPARSDSLESRLYYEFLDFYKLSGINYLSFTREGSWAKLQTAVCKGANEPWSSDDKRNFSTFYNTFLPQFEALGGAQLSLTVGDAMLVYLSVYRYSDARDTLGPQLRTNLEKIWDEVKILTQQQAVEVMLEPQIQPAAKPLLAKILPSLTSRHSDLNVVFLHEYDSSTSAWTASHGQGRVALEKAFPDMVYTSHIDHIQPEVDAETRLEAAVRNGADVVFTSSSQMMPACLKVAARHPHAKILNCSLNVPHPSVRTYYPRMYEAKYLLGLLAGILSRSNQVGYVANYPIYGIPASINAFALGVQTVRPDAEILLRWDFLENEPFPLDFSDRPDVSIFCGRDQREPKGINRDYGLCRRLADNSLQDIAVPEWCWGNIYKEILRTILDGTWDNEEAGTPRAINYWWGMKSGAVRIQYSESIPAGTLALVKLIEQRLRSDEFTIFERPFYAQGHVLRAPAQGDRFTASELIQMDWLAENVVGSLPKYSELSPKGRHLVDFQGIAASKEEV